MKKESKTENGIQSEHLWDHEISSTQGSFEPTRVNQSARSGG